MTDERSFLFDFVRTDYFFDQLNNLYHLRDMDGSSGKFKIVIAHYGGDNLSDYLTNQYSLNVSSSNSTSQSAKLRWSDECIKLDADVTFNIGNDVKPIKAIFLCTNDDVVIGYCINMTKFSVTNQVKFDKDTIFWSIRDE